MKIYTWHLVEKTHDCGFFWSAKKSHLPHFSPPDLFLPGQTVTLVWVRSKTICFFPSIAWPRGRFRLTEEIMIPGWVGALRTRGLDFITERGLVVDEVRFWDNDPTDQKFCHVHPQLCPNMAFLLGNPLYFYVSSGRLPWSWMLDRKSDKKWLVPQLLSSFIPTHAGFRGKNKTTLFWNALLGAQLKIFFCNNGEFYFPFQIHNSSSLHCI